MYYIYAYLHPETFLPFYISKGKGSRLLHHLSETYDRTENKKKYSYIRSLRNKGNEPLVVRLFTNIYCEKTAYQLEEQLIAKYGRRDIDPDGILTNICKNNRPPRVQMTPIRRKKLIQRMLGNTFAKGKPSPFKNQKRPELQGINNGFFQKKHTKETRQKMSAKAQGRPGSRLGTKQTEECKKKIQLNNPHRKSIHTPQGIFLSVESYAKSIGLITPEGLRNLFKDQDLPISKRRAERCPLLTMSDIGKTPREIGYHYL